MPHLLFLPNILLRDNEICVRDQDRPIAVNITRLMPSEKRYPYSEWG